MKILWVTSEATPYAKTGGLADVSGALPEALAKRGHQVTVFMPYYRQQMGKLNLKFTGRLDLIGVPFGAGMEWAGVNILQINDNLTFMFLEYGMNTVTWWPRFASASGNAPETSARPPVFA